jgi:phosphoribosylaminoimidazole-succinocarboxamide synthase
MSILLESNLPDVKLYHRGKVRDVYDLEDSLLIIASDRISAFDCVIPTGIPDKGKILTSISLFWFDYLSDVIENHLIETDVNNYPSNLQKYKDQLEGRSMIVKKADMIEVECIVRGYIAGSGWKDYQKTGAICGIELPEGLKESEQLPEIIFTPSTKAEKGMHDENVSFDYIVKEQGQEICDFLKNKSIEIYKKASEYAKSKGIILCDTKFEFGKYEDKIILIDEVLTPDSSRFWDCDNYKIGQSNDSFDKQFVRDFLQGLDWDKTPPAPELPEDIVSATRDKYLDALYRLTGKKI